MSDEASDKDLSGESSGKAQGRVHGSQGASPGRGVNPKRSRRVGDYLSRSELRELTQASDRAGWLAVATSWILISGSFALVALWPGIVTILVALIIIGGRQLALAILMHEAAHRSLFKTRWLNDAVGTWLCAAPSWQQLDQYRRHHLAHHAHTMQSGDPDVPLTTGYPTSFGSLARKFARDLVGITGVKRIIAQVQMDLGFVEYTAANVLHPIPQKGRTTLDIVRHGLDRMGPVVLVHVLMYMTLAELGVAWVFLVWVAAYMTTFSLFLRVRSLAEHAAIIDESSPDADEVRRDLFRNTRTTYAGLLARLTVAPHRVNYHLEHHLLMTVPQHKLPEFHRLLLSRGALGDSPVEPNYAAVLRKATAGRRRAPAAAADSATA